MKSTELVKATGSRGLRHVVSTITGDGGDGDVQGTASHHRGCTAACPKGEGKACSGCHMGFGNITPDTWKALCAEYEEFDKFEAEYKSTPFKPKTRVKYKGRWYRVRKRHRTTIATGSLYQLQPVGGGTKLVNKCVEKDLTPRTRHMPPPDLYDKGGAVHMLHYSVKEYFFRRGHYCKWVTTQRPHSIAPAS